MAALEPQYMSILKKTLSERFVPFLPPLLNSKQSPAEQDKKQLSRAFSAFALHKVLDIGVAPATSAVVDDFDDNGIDAIFYDSKGKALHLVQSKLQAGKQFDEADAIRFRSGVELLLAQKYEKFNENVQKRKVELDNVFDEAEKIQLLVAYVGSGISQHATAAIHVLTADEDHHEVGRLSKNLIEYGPELIRADLLAEQSMGTVNDTLNLSKWQHVAGARETHVGIASLADLVALHAKHKKALYERNIRYFLGSRESAVNRSIQETLRSAPQDFFYLNNGVTALADLVESPKGTKAVRRLRFRGFSIINGAQTISSAAEFAERHPDCDISAARVLVTVIRADAEGKFGRAVTRARNHQNPVSTANFASLDPKQEELRRELAHLGFSYHYRPEAMPRSPDDVSSIITIEQAMKALALMNPDPRYTFWMKNDIARFQDTESTEYNSLFDANLAGVQLANRVALFRFIRDVIASAAEAAAGAERLFYKHGIFLIAAVIAKRFRKKMTSLTLFKTEDLNTLASPPLDACRQLCWEHAAPLVGQGRSVLSFFQRQGNTLSLLEACMTAVYGLDKAEEYLSLKGKSDPKEAFPREKCFRYLSSQAPQIEDSI